MRTQKQQHYLLLLPSLTIALFFLLPAPLLNAAPSTASCSASANHTTTCSSKKLNISFPFFTSAECHNSESSFIISHCEPSDPFPDWPAFTKNATKGSTLNSTVVSYMYTPFPTDPLESQNSSYASGLQFDPHSGYITLLWSAGLLDQHVCGTLADHEQISQFIPHSINLQEFAHSTFNFDSSTIILLFSCNPTKVNPSSYLQMNGTACTAYEKECKPNKNESYNCYQYMTSNPSKELSLPQLMNTSGCKQAMFFVALDPSLILLPWIRGAIMLNWNATGTDWLASTFQECARCLASNGTCGYDRRGEFECSCVINCSNQNISRPASPCPRPDASPSSRNTTVTPVQKKYSNGAKLGVAVATIAVVVTAASIVPAFCCLLKPKLLFKSVKTTPEFSHPILSVDLEKLTERPVEISYSSIVSATSNFNNVLGEGGFGVVYRGLLTGVPVAVKVVAEVTSEHRKKYFLNEVATIGRIHHVHVVRLLGFCMEQHLRLLVYEYVNNGALDNWLFKHRDNPERRLSWTQRYNIAVGIAKGLGYLHEECRHRIVHCDIKPQNILLDENLCPKIADFGLAKLMTRGESAVATIARGTPGYIAPEFWMGGEGQISTKFDVYSFGMVLLELISGRKNFENGSCFPEEAFEAAVKGNIQFIIDAKLGMTMPAKNKPAILEWQHVRRALFVALWCIQDHPMSRPHMSEVVLYLEGKIAVDERPPRPAIASILLSLPCQQ